MVAGYFGIPFPLTQLEFVQSTLLKVMNLLCENSRQENEQSHLAMLIVMVA